MLAGCADFSVECEFIVMPRTMIAQNSSPDTPSYRARVYAFYNVGKDRTQVEKEWAPASYADAEAGIIRHKGSGEIRSYSLMGEQGDDTYVRLIMTSSPVVLVALDPVHRLYACGAFEYMPPMNRMQFPVHFQVWKQMEEYYKEGYWTIRSAMYEETPPQQDNTDA